MIAANHRSENAPKVATAKWRNQGRHDGRRARPVAAERLTVEPRDQRAVLHRPRRSSRRVWAVLVRVFDRRATAERTRGNQTCDRMLATRDDEPFRAPGFQFR